MMIGKNRNDVMAVDDGGDGGGGQDAPHPLRLLFPMTFTSAAARIVRIS